jgi:drug/metabolite transporter (DMT)-like permease
VTIRSKIPWSDLGLLTTILFWALNMPIVKTAFTTMDPLAFNTARFLMVPPLILSIVYLLEKSLYIARKDWVTVGLIGLIGVGGYQYFFVLGLNLTNSSSAALLAATTPIWVALWGQIRGSEKLSRIGWAGILVSFGGVFVILFDGRVMSVDAMTGDILILCSAICWAYYTIAAKALLKIYTPLRITAIALSVGAIPVLLLGARQITQVDWSAVRVQDWGAMGYSVIFSITIAYILWYNGVSKVGSTRTGIYMSLLPACGVISAYYILGDPITTRDIIGAATIITGLTLARRG